MSSYQYRKSHCGDKTILRPSYLHNGISYTGKMTFLYWIRAQLQLTLIMLTGTIITHWGHTYFHEISRSSFALDDGLSTVQYQSLPEPMLPCPQFKTWNNDAQCNLNPNMKRFFVSGNAVCCGSVTNLLKIVCSLLKHRNFSFHEISSASMKISHHRKAPWSHL